MMPPDAARINRKYTAKKRSFSLRFSIFKIIFHKLVSAIAAKNEYT